jgi:hypothetical protein
MLKKAGFCARFLVVGRECCKKYNKNTVKSPISWQKIQKTLARA